MLPEDASNSANASTSTSNILSLNNDCLAKICTYLNLREHLSFANVCARFRYVVQWISRRLYKECDFYKISYLTPFEMLEFFHWAGESFEQITSEEPFRDRDFMVTVIGRNCPNLKKVTLCNCFLNDECVEVLQAFLKKIESLTLCDSRNITGKYMSGMIHLRELNLSGCIRVRASHLMAIFAAAPNLRLLDIRGCRRSRPEMYEALLKYCQQIEVLKLSCPKFSYACLASLPRLRELFLVDGAPKGATKLCLYQQLAHRPRQFEVLNIRSNSSLTAEHLTLISQLQSLRELTLSHNLVVNNDGLAKLCKLRNLEVLGIKGCMCISAKGLLKLLQHCTKLHQLNIIFIRNITCKFVLDSIPILWRTYNERKRKFVLLAFNTNIQEKSLRDEVQYLEAVEKSLIEVRDVLNPADLYGGPYYNYSRIGPCINNYEDDLYSTDEEENVAFLLANMSGKSFI